VDTLQQIIRLLLAVAVMALLLGLTATAGWLLAGLTL
jgi:hypothetical protein